MTPKINLGFSDFTDNELNTLAQHVIDSMTGNLNFKDSTDLLAIVVSKKTKFNSSLAKSKDGGHPEIVAKNEDRAELVTALYNLGLYVQGNSKGSVSILVSSGYPLQKEKEPVGTPAEPTNVQVEKGPISCSAVVSCDPIKGVKHYYVEYTDAPVTETSVWKAEFGSRKIMLKDLKFHQDMAIRMCGIGSSGVKAFAPTVTYFVV
jgi:hypothetical protein